MSKVTVTSQEGGYWLAKYEDELGAYLATSTKGRGHALFAVGVVVGGRDLPDVRQLVNETEVEPEGNTA